jgi:diguanylate cyclase (GGDEF)-like protein
MSHLADYRISGLLAEFADARVEWAFRRATHVDRVRETRVAISIAALFYLVFAFFDFLNLGFSEAYQLILFTRLSVVTAALLFALTARYFWRALMAGVTPTLVVGAGLVGFLTMTLLRPYDLGGQSMSFMVMLVATYVFIPNRFLFATLLGVLASLAFLWLIDQHFQPAVRSLAAIALLLLMVNLFGVRTAYRVSRLTRAHYHDVETLRAANRQLAEEVAQRQRLESELRVLLERDELTDIANRRHFLSQGERVLSAARLHSEPVCLLILDIDYFKQLNQTYGHSHGDAVLLTLVAVCQRNLPESALLARLGGEEFAILLSKTALRPALQVGERLRGEIQRTPVRSADVAMHFTVSIGVAQWNPGESIDSLLQRGDAARQLAKSQGRNRVALEPSRRAGQNGNLTLEQP